MSRLVRLPTERDDTVTLCPNYEFRDPDNRIEDREGSQKENPYCINTEGSDYTVHGVGT